MCADYLAERYALQPTGSNSVFLAEVFSFLKFRLSKVSEKIICYQKINVRFCHHVKLKV